MSDAEPVNIPRWKRALPNRLTMLRLVLAGVFFALLATHQYAEPLRTPIPPGIPSPPSPLLLAAAIFVLAALTDALDGHLARKWRVVSLFGRVMDPFADKVLVLGAFVLLAGPNFAVRLTPAGGTVLVTEVQPWMAVVILARELLVTSLRGAYESRGVDFSATASGKWKMILQCVAVPLVLTIVAFTPTWRHVADAEAERTAAGWIVFGVVWLTVLVSAWSGVPYVRRAIRASKALQAPSPRTPSA